MSAWYLDTSAALKLLIEEPESQPLAQTVDREQPDLVAGWLLETELRRAAQRLGVLGMPTVPEFLEGVSLYEMPAFLFREAGILPGETLRALDALHLAAAVRIGVDLVLTYDTRMAESAGQLGLQVLSPA